MEENMNKWVIYPTTLLGEYVDLVPLEKEHFEELETLAKDKRIWAFYAYDGSNPQVFSNIFNSALDERDAGSQLPFTIYYKPENKIIGSTRYLDIQPKHKKLEIGSTWLHPDYWATAVNLECKLLLLTHCFENLKALRVQLKTDENNIRSRKAIEKIGGQFEGILRKDILRDNNTHRNSAYYSIIDTEWAEKKLNLIDLYLAKKNNTI